MTEQMIDSLLAQRWRLTQGAGRMQVKSRNRPRSHSWPCRYQSRTQIGGRWCYCISPEYHARKISTGELPDIVLSMTVSMAPVLLKMPPPFAVPPVPESL